MRSKPAEKSLTVAGVQVRVQGQAGAVIARGGIGVLSADELERLDVLEHEVVLHRETVVIAPLMVERDGGAVVVDVLRGVGVERARIDVGPVGKLAAVSAQNGVDDFEFLGVAGQRRAPRRRPGRARCR